MGGIEDGWSSFKDVKFDNAAATSMANYCMEFTKSFDQVNQNLDHVLSVPDFSPVNPPDGSGHQLGEKFRHAADQLRDGVIAQHLAILEDLARTFIQAGKVLYEAEDQSAEVFTKMRTNSHLAGESFRPGAVNFPHWVDSETPDAAPYHLPDSGALEVENGKLSYLKDFDNKLKDLPELRSLADEMRTPGVVADGSPVAPEPGVTLQWEDFFNHYQVMLGEIDKIRQAAEDWLGFVNVLHSGKLLFQQRAATVLVKDELWVGDSSKAARTAIRGYVDYQLEPLTRSMNIISENLADSASWLTKLQEFLPEESWNAVTCKAGYTPQLLESMLTAYRTKWDEWYGEGVHSAASAIPVMPLPQGGNTSPLVPAPPDPAAPPAVVPPVAPPVTAPVSPVSALTGSGDQKAAMDTGGGPALDGIPTVDQPGDPAADKQPEAGPQSPQPDQSQQPAQQLQSMLQQGEQALQQAAQQGSQLAQQGASALQQGLQSAAQTAQQALQQAAQQSTQAAALATGLPDAATADPVKAGGGAGGGGAGAGRAGLGGGSGPEGPRNSAATQRLFPRAAAATTEPVTTGRAGLAAAGTTGAGSPGMAGPAAHGGGQGQQNKEHKRPEYLKNTENLDEALGEAPGAVRPVVEK
jgi:hypothetical protein